MRGKYGRRDPENSPSRQGLKERFTRARYLDRRRFEIGRTRPDPGAAESFSERVEAESHLAEPAASRWTDSPIQRPKNRPSRETSR